MGTIPHESLPPMDLSKFHVLTMISNSQRYKSRPHLYNQFKKHLTHSGIQLWTAEVAFGRRHFEVTQHDDVHDLQLRVAHDGELWQKERALNLLVEHLSHVSPDWQYIAWVDADLEFPAWSGPAAWYAEAVHQMQHFAVVQLFQNAVDLGPRGETMHVHKGFAYSYRYALPWKAGYVDWHPGFGWAMRREAFEACRFIDFGILGSGDRHMACGWIGEISQSLNRKCASPYHTKLLAWQEQAERYIRRNIGFVPGTILHHWHGKKKDRRYSDRWKILVDLQFDPDRDIKLDANGLWRLADHGDLRSVMLRDKIRDYFASRNEDSTDAE